MASQYQQMRERILALSDDELIHMVTEGASEYRPDALEIAQLEMRSRGLSIPSDDEDEEEAEETSELEQAPEQDVEISRAGAAPDSVRTNCVYCGGRLRAGTLVAEKETTIIFADTREERFVNARACRDCGLVSLIVDFNTTVEA